MITDERLDQLTRSALEWHASRSVATQPTLRQATGRLADRVGSSSPRVQPHVTLAPATIGGLNLLIVLLLLLAAAIAVAVGAVLLRDSRPDGPGPFGFATFCGEPLPAGYVLSFGVQDGYRYVHPSGSLHSDPAIIEHADGSALTRSEYVESTTYLERRLTPGGVNLLRERVEALGLTNGCVRIQTQEQSGAVYSGTGEGIVGLAWSRYEGGLAYASLRRATEEEEAELAQLSADLDDLERWLPAEAWIESVERRVQPDRWLIYLTVTERNRVSPAYENVVLPGGVEPAAFGEELRVDPFDLDDVITSRCGVVERSDAFALAASMDSMPTPGWIALAPAFPSGVECDSFATDRVTSRQPPAEPTPFIDGEFANVDPCRWVSVDAADAISGAAPELLNRRSSSPLGTWDPLCEIRDATVMGTRATVSVHSHSMNLATAQTTAHDLLGGSVEQDAIAGRTVWINECLITEIGCWWSIAVSSEPYFVVITVDARNQLTPDHVRAFVEAVLESI